MSTQRYILVSLVKILLVVLLLILLFIAGKDFSGDLIAYPSFCGRNDDRIWCHRWRQSI